MRQAKRSHSGFSNRENVRKSKRSYHAPNTLNNMFLGDFNRKHGIGLAILSLIIIGGIGGYYLYKSPAFTTPQSNDPFQTLYNDNLGNCPTSLDAWNTILASCASLTTNGIGGGA